MDLNKLKKEVNLNTNTQELVGLFLFSARLTNDLTQKQVAEKMGVDEEVIHKLEGGSHPINLYVYSQALEKLNIPWRAFVMSLRVMYEKPEVQEDLEDPENLEFILNHDNSIYDS